MKPLKHQEKFISNYTGSRLLVHEGGTGKTICACLWLKDNRDNDGLVICPKKVVKKWQNELNKWGAKSTVMSKEEFKVFPIKKWSAIVFDEADEFASPLFVAKLRSQLTTKAYELIRAYPEIPTLLLTATPIRSNPWNLHTLLCLMGIYIDWKKWREYFFELKYPDYGEYRFLQRPAYMPRPNWRELIKVTLEKYADIVNLRDCVEELPAVTEEEILIKTPKYIRQEDDKPFYSEHRHEQQNKVKTILDISKEYRKVLVVAFYTEQVEDLYKKLSKDRETFAIYGGIPTNKQEDIIKQAQDSAECFFIVQSGTGVGFDADMFSVIIFASMSYSIRDHVQMKWRVTRIRNLHPVKYFILLGGRCDKAILENIKLGKTFVPSQWIELNK